MSNIQVTIGGQDLSNYCESLEREAHLCQPSTTFTLQMSPNTSRTNLIPWSTAVLYEQGVKVLTGYVDQVFYTRPPARIKVRGKDNWKRATDWFIPEQLYSAGEQVGAWVSYFCNLVGLSYVITATSGSTNAVKLDLPLGLKHVSESLLGVCAYAGWCIRVRPDGVVDFRPTNPPISPDYTLTTPMAVDDERNDDSTRNVVKVYGLTSGSNVGPLYKETRSVPRITGDRIMVFGDPNIDTYDKASALGRAALDQFADLERKTTLHTVGNPNFLVGESVRFYPTGGSTSSAIGIITDLTSSISTNEYRHNLTIGRRCYRLPFFGVRGYYYTPSAPPSSGSSLLTGILAYWKIDETSGVTRFDSVSSGSANGIGLGYNPDDFPDSQAYSGGIIGYSLLNPAYDPTPPVPSSALSMSASSTSVASFFNNDRTVCIWAKISDKSTNQAIIGRVYAVGASDLTEWGIDYRVSTGIEGAVDRFRLVAGVPSGPQRNANTLGSPAVDQWYFFVVTQEGATGVTFKINNVLQYSAAELFGVSNSGTFMVGGRRSGLFQSDLIVGQCDEVGIWGRKLTDEEQTDLYNAGAGRTYPFT